MEKIRLQKFLADAGVASRRAAENLILAGKIKVNGKVVKVLGFKVDPDEDQVEYKREILKPKSKKVYIVLHKPFGYVTACQDQREKTVLDLVDVPERVFPVGRLDKDSTGLVLLTNDGDLAYKLTHPKFKHVKEYLVEVDKNISPTQLKQLKKGVSLDEQKTYPAQIKRLGAKKFLIAIHEGRNRQVRRMCQHVGLKVTRLKRTRLGKLHLGNLAEGEWRRVPLRAIV